MAATTGRIDVHHHFQVPGILMDRDASMRDWSPAASLAHMDRQGIGVAMLSHPTEVAEVIIAGEDDVDLPRAIAELGLRGAKSVLAEGGPTLNGELARAGLLDELCVTLSPLLASGDAKRIIAGSTLDILEPLDLRSICEEDNYLFLRYRPR